jgi:SAM-dependent methyltransferase
MNIPCNILFRVFHHLASVFHPGKKTLKTSNIPYSPHLKFIIREDVKEHIQNYRKSHSGDLTFLDIGGRKGEYRKFADGFDYKILEINESASEENIIIGDICHCPEIPNDSFDICFSNNVFEHLKEPWLAAEGCIRITKVNGLIIHIAPFSWRYHPVPVDFFRYSHEGMAYLFERNGAVKRILSEYDISSRRRDRRGGKLQNNLDTPPIDELGGWRENWLTIYIGIKK